MDPKIILEISGHCNAKCPWCYTGRRNRLGMRIPSRFMPPEEFNNVLSRLDAIGLLERRDNLIELFNWGEPLLHPRFSEIVSILNVRGLDYRLSTNGSRIPELNGQSAAHLRELIISLPGFSPYAYARGSGFRFPEILERIDALVDRFKESGFQGRTILSYHIYQFNIQDIPAAAEYAAGEGFSFNPYLATPMDFQVALGFLKRTLPSSVLDQMSRDLMLYSVETLIAKQTPEYSCFQQNKMVIDENGSVLTCCIVPKGHPDYSLGSIFELGLEEIKTRKKGRGICKECLDQGLSYWFMHPSKPAFLSNLLPGQARGPAQKG